MRVSHLILQVPSLSQVDPPEKKNASGEKFVDALREAFNNVNEIQKAADKATQQYLVGEVDNIHDVMLATQKANLTLQLTVQVRNKVIEAYQEISRMQI